MNYALITGGSSGMGLDYAKELAKRGYNLILVALDQGETERAAEIIKGESLNVDILPLGIDLSKMDSYSTVWERVKQERPHAFVEILINNAGVLYPSHFQNMELEQISRIIMIHNYTLTMLCRLFLPPMLEREGGYILNVSSMATLFPYPFISTYSATKSYTKVFTKALRTELKGTGVKVSSIYFGAVATKLYVLPPHLEKLAIRLGVMLPSQKAVRTALKMMFRGRSGWTPGVVNKIAIAITRLIPSSLIHRIDRFATKKWNLK